MGDPKPLTAYQQTYHWRNKNCGTWAHDWVKKSLPGISVEEAGAKAEISEVTNVSGDCDLGQRKGKLLTIYDLEVEMNWTGTDAEGNEVKGKIQVPEFSHEAIDGLSEYVYNISLTTSSTPSSESLLSVARKQFPGKLTSKFNSFREELLNAHGIFADGASPAISGTSTPVPTASGSYSPAPPAATASGAAAPAPAPAAAKKSVTSTSSVEVSANLQASAEDIWGLVTDQNKIPMWSRSPAKLSLEAGSSFELFDKNITGKIISSDPPKQLVQSWQVKKPNWPSDHFATMTISLVQGSDSTALTFKLDGVPTGQESDIEGALNTFYIRGLKQMGLGTIL